MNCSYSKEDELAFNIGTYMSSRFTEWTVIVGAESGAHAAVYSVM